MSFIVNFCVKPYQYHACHTFYIYSFGQYKGLSPQDFSFCPGILNILRLSLIFLLIWFYLAWYKVSFSFQEISMHAIRKDICYIKHMKHSHVLVSPSYIMQEENIPKDTNEKIKIRILKKNRQHNGQMKKYKKRSTKHTHKTKDRVTRTPLRTGGEFRCSGRVSNSCSTSGTRRVNLVTIPVTSHRWGPRSLYDKLNISVVVRDTDIP